VSQIDEPLLNKAEEPNKEQSSLQEISIKENNHSCSKDKETYSKVSYSDSVEVDKEKKKPRTFFNKLKRTKKDNVQEKNYDYGPKDIIRSAALRKYSIVLIWLS